LSTKSWRELDPFYTREVKRHERPIPSREFILRYLEKEGIPQTAERLAKGLNLTEDYELEALRRRLQAMKRDGQLICNRLGHYVLVDRKELVSGRVVGHPDGFGFLIRDEGGEDIYLSPREMRMLLHGDRAVVRVVGVDRRGRPEGVVIEVLEHNTHQVVGRFIQERGVALVVPHNKRLHQDIILPAEYQASAQPGQIVVAELLQQPDRHSPPVGRIIEVLGEHMAPGMEIDIAIRAYELPHHWPDDVQAETAGLAPEVPESAKAGREDIRQLPLVTIDGPDARDFDDAVYGERSGKGWRLWVAIADVSWYVAQGTALDTEALKRGNSVYFPERAIPMLPEVLSNGLCSLNPGVDRLCIVCELSVSATGKLRQFRLFEGVMRSAARLIYEDVAALLEGDQAQRERYRDLVPYLEALHGLYKVLRAARAKRGAIDFETTETRIEFGPDRKIDRIVPVVRNDAHRMIEEFMILANTATAQYLTERTLPGLYRVHEGPSEQKLTDLREFLGELGLKLAGGKRPKPKHYAELLEQVRERPDIHLIQTVLLRSLSQAVYTPENPGHFGLALETYTHFTSPIRRYPDLLVHRAIRHALAGGSAETFAYTPVELQGLGEHCSMTERRADEATRDATDWLKCEYMMDKVGAEFDGVITSVTGFGIFVELKDIYVEGLVHITSLGDDYYHFDPVKHHLWGERTRQVYRLGDDVRIRVMRVSLDDKKIDFELARGRRGKKRSRA
jgi:ribonuclease R